MDDDDDFGEFGGFEAAEPSAPAVAQPISGAVASPSPWAVFNPVPPESAKMSSEQFPNDGGMSTAAESNEVWENRNTAGTDNDEQSENRADLRQFQRISDAHGIRKDCGKDSESEMPASSTSVFESTSVSQLKDGGRVSGPGENTAESADQWLEGLNNLSKLISTDSSTSHKSSPVEGETIPVKSCTDEPENFYQQQLQSAREEKSLIEQELQLLREREEDLESGLTQCREDLETQRQKYEEIQKKHSVDLEEMRKAGMDALAIIVEEYKELSRTAVLQQQETCEKQLTAKLQSQTEQCKQLLEEQHTRLLALLEEDREKQEKMLTEALGKQQQTQQTQFEGVLEEERKSLKEHLNKSLEDQKEFLDSTVGSSVEQLKAESKTMAVNQKEDLIEMIEEHTDKMKRTVMAELEEKQKKTQGVLEKSVEVDRDKSKQLIREAMEKTKQEMISFIHDEKQADQVVRQKQLTSLQLFLESAKSQVSHLLSDSSQDRPL